MFSDREGDIHAMRDLMAVLNGQLEKSFVLRIVKDEGRWLVTLAPLSGPATWIGQGYSFGVAWTEAMRPDGDSWLAEEAGFEPGD